MIQNLVIRKEKKDYGHKRDEGGESEAGDLLRNLLV
jgi:hypothetical protein